MNNGTGPSEDWGSGGIRDPEGKEEEWLEAGWQEVEARHYTWTLQRTLIRKRKEPKDRMEKQPGRENSVYSFIIWTLPILLT